MEEKSKKKYIIPLSGIALVMLLVGLAYAAWTYTFSGTETSTISTPTVELELLESDVNVINIQNALPISDTQGKALTNTFDFAVTSKTLKDIDIDYTISLEKLTVDTGYTAMSDNQIKLYLTDYSGNAIWTSATNNVKKVSELSNYVITTGTHSHDSTHNKVQDKYKLRAWVSNDVDASDWTSSTKLQYKFRIGVLSNEQVANNQGEHVNTTRYIYSQDNLKVGDNINSYEIKFNDLIYLADDYEQLSNYGPEKYQICGENAGDYMCTDFDYSDSESCEAALETQSNLDSPYCQSSSSHDEHFYIKGVVENDIITATNLCYRLSNTEYCFDDTFNYENGVRLLNSTFAQDDCDVNPYDENRYYCEYYENDVYNMYFDLDRSDEQYYICGSFIYCQGSDGRYFCGTSN